MKKQLWLPLAVLLSWGCYGSPFPDKPKLIIYIVIDQLPGELFQRIENEFIGGFKWLLDHGIEFRNTHHEHGYTVTGVGHFVLGSGRYPGPAGVLGNSWYSRELRKSIYCVEDSLAISIGGEGKGRSYRQTRATAVGDWMKKADSKSKVFTVAGKDRSAVLLGGKNPDLAIYYNYDGSFISSDYYANQLPEWLVDFNQNLNFLTYRDSVWDHFAPPEFYQEFGTVDNFIGEYDLFDNDPYSPTLPISMKNKSPEEVNNTIAATPWFDRIVLDLAERTINNEQLGEDHHTDLLCIGLSAADWIGHNNGPHSHEILDYYMRIDKNLMKFIHQVDLEIGLENVMFVLSSDHGTMPLPEYLQEKGIDAGRLNTHVSRERIDNITHKTNNEIMYEAGGFYFPEEYSEKQKKAGLEIIETELKDMKGIERFITKKEILNMDGLNSFERRMKNMIHPEKSADVFILMKENYCYKYPYGTSHGTPYDYDTYVPLVFSNIQMEPQKVERPIATVDIAPSIASLLNIPIPNEVDGKTIFEISNK